MRDHSRFLLTHDLPFGGRLSIRDSCLATVSAAPLQPSVTVDGITHEGHEAPPLTSLKPSQLRHILDKYRPAQADTIPSPGVVVQKPRPPPAVPAVPRSQAGNSCRPVVPAIDYAHELTEPGELAAHAPVARGEEFDACYLTVDTPFSGHSSNPYSRVPPHQVLRSGRGNARLVEFRLVNRASPSNLDDGNVFPSKLTLETSWSNYIHHRLQPFRNRSRLLSSIVKYSWTQTRPSSLKCSSRPYLRDWFDDSN